MNRACYQMHLPADVSELNINQTADVLLIRKRL